MAHRLFLRRIKLGKSLFHPDRLKHRVIAKTLVAAGRPDDLALDAALENFLMPIRPEVIIKQAMPASIDIPPAQLKMASEPDAESPVAIGDPEKGEDTPPMNPPEAQPRTRNGRTPNAAMLM